MAAPGGVAGRDDHEHNPDPDPPGAPDRHRRAATRAGLLRGRRGAVLPARPGAGDDLARAQGAHHELLAALDSPRYARLLAELDRVTAGPPRGPQAAAPARDILPAAIRRAYRQAKRRMRRARHTPAGPARDIALHRARKSARRARYAAEAAAPAVGPQARRFARQMKKVQSVLGDHQDAVLARHEARDLGIGAHLADENAFTYGLLYELEQHRAEQRQAAARRVWRRAARRRYRHWMNEGLNVRSRLR